MKGKTRATIAVENARRLANQYREHVRFLHKHRKFINEIEVTPSVTFEYVDFDCLPHEKVVQVIEHFGGSWKKTLNGTKVDYVRQKLDSEKLTVRCWSGEPPPNCHIITQVIHIPEKLVPAHDETVHTLQCV